MNFVKIFISAGLAFFIAIIVALLIEKLGGALGSIIGTVPTTLIPTVIMIFTGVSQTVEQKTESSLALVFGIVATDLLFMPTWKILPPRLPTKWKNGMKVLVTTVISLVLWFIGAILMIVLQSALKSAGVNMWVFAITSVLIIIIYGVIMCWSLPPTPPGKNKVKWYNHLFRGVAAFFALFVCGILSQSGLGVAAGAMGTFPAIFMTAMVSVSLSQRAEVAAGAIGPLILGSISGATFSIFCSVGFGLFKFEPWLACVFGFCVSVFCWSIPIYFFVKWRRDTTAAKKLRIKQQSEIREIEIPQMEITEDEKKSPISNENDDADGSKKEGVVAPLETQLTNSFVCFRMNWFKIFLTSGLAFFIAIGVALLIEKLGGALGSIIGSVPSTHIPSIYLILTELTQSIEHRTESALAFAVGIFVTNLLVMPTWKILPSRLPSGWMNGKKIFVTTVVSVCLWLIGAVIAISIQSELKSRGVSMWTFITCIILLNAIYGICLCWSLPPTPAGKNKVKCTTHLTRGSAAFCAIFVSGVLSQSGLGVAAGAMATFPALHLTALVAVSISQNAEVAAGAIGPLILGSLTYSIYAYACAFSFSVLHLHPALCCLVGFVFSVSCWSVPIYFFIKWRRDTTAKKKMLAVQANSTKTVDLEMKDVKADEKIDNSEL